MPGRSHGNAGTKRIRLRQMSSGFHRDGDPTPQKQVQGQNYEAANNKLLIEFAHVEKNLLRKELMRKTDQVKAPNIAHFIYIVLQYFK